MLISIIKSLTCAIGTDCSSSGNMLSFYFFGCPTRVMAVVGQCWEVAHHTGYLFLLMSLEQADIYSLFVGVHVSLLSVFLLLHDVSQSKYHPYGLILLHHREASPHPVHWFRPQAPLWASGPPQAFSLKENPTLSEHSILWYSLPLVFHSCFLLYDSFVKWNRCPF